MHYRLHRFFGRHHGERGFIHFGKAFAGGAGRGSRVLGMGRQLAASDLQLLILGLLAEKPCHGYEVIEILDERSKGFYRPSPGMVYPALTYLEEIGRTTVDVDGARKLYRITEAGQGYLESKRSIAEELFTQFVRVGEHMDRMRRGMQADDSGEDLTENYERRGSKDMQHARKALKLALVDKWDSSTEEQERVVDVLRRATAEILGQ